MKIIFLTLSILILSQLIYSQNSFSAQLTIEHGVLQGEYTDVNLDIYKPEGARNYTVFTQKLPEGFFVKMTDTQGAIHSYENNILTLTWMRCPSDSKISVRYQIVSMQGVSGEFNISGKLTYMVGSKQGIFNLNPYSLNVVKEKTLISNKIETKNNLSGKLDPKKTINTRLKGVYCKRKVIYNKKTNDYNVEIILKKSKSGSFSITEKVPNNFQFSEIDTHQAKIIQQSGLVQFIWLNEQKDKDLKIKYKLTPKENTIEPPQILGKLSFLNNGQILNMSIISLE